MYKTYLIRNKISGSYYIGMTKQSLGQRWSAHKSAAKSGRKSKFYDAIRKYGVESFEMTLHRVFNTKEECCEEEIYLIYIFRQTGINLYNIADGGQTGNVISPEKKDEWRKKLSKARRGRKPALGMKHTEDNKKFFRECGKARWDNCGRYPDEIINHSFKEANSKFGISRTHYYRLLKRTKSNELS